MRTRPRSRAALIAAAAATLAAMAPFARVDDRAEFLIFVAFVALGELFEVTLSGEHHSLGLAPGLAFALLSLSPLETTAAFALGALVAFALRTVMRRRGRLEEVASRILLIACVSAIYTLIATNDELSPLHTGMGEVSISMIALAVIAVAVLVLDPLMRAMFDVLEQRLPFWPLFRDRLQALGGLHLSVVSVAGLLALSYPTLGLWSLPLFVAPLAATQYSFRQLQYIRTTYLQTIRALSRVPEVAGLTNPGHSARVAELATAIAAELGMRKDELTEIEYAALLHDIGRVRISDPSTELATVSRNELAMIGAGIVEETGYFPRVGQMISQQYSPYRRRGEDLDRTLPPGSKIIKVASTYDELITAGRSAWDALERLYLDTAYEYDPTVIQALMRVLERRGEI